MKSISEVWDKGKLISREEHDDGTITLEELEKRVVELERKLR